MRVPPPKRPEDVVIAEHDRLIHSLLKRHCYARVAATCGVDYDDLLQEGRMGLMRAVQTWDPALSAWSTYALSWVRAYVQRYIANHGAVVHVPYYLQERRRKAGERMRPYVESMDQVRVTQQRSGGAREGTLHDVLPASETEQLSHDIPQSSLDALLESTPGLSLRQVRVLRLRAAGRTLEEIAGEMGVTRERVRQIEAEAIAWTRHVHGVRVDP